MAKSYSRVKSLTGYNISLDAALKQGGYYGPDGIWNSLIRIDGKVLRGRVETLIFKKDQQQVYMHIKNFNKKKYRLPGGSFEKDTPNYIQAQNEVNEEARIKVKNLVNSGQHYIHLYKTPAIAYGGNNRLDWAGNYTEVYIAEYDGVYTGNIDDRDKDDEMYENGKFYNIYEVYPILKDVHRNIIDEIFPNIKKGAIDENMVVLKESNNEVHYYPYYTPREMSKLGVFNESKNKYSDIQDEAIEWYLEYTDTLHNDDSENWLKELKYRYSNYTEQPTLENKQLILNLGWNPEIPVTLENVLKASNKTAKRINKTKDEIIAIDENMIFSKKEIVCNLDDFDSGKSNILLVTGMSGSGKTTYAHKVRSVYEDSEVIELDYFQCYDSINAQMQSNPGLQIGNKTTYDLVKKYIDSHSDVKKDTKYFYNITMEGFEKYFIPFFDWLVNTLKKNKNKRYIIEGIHIMLYIPYKQIDKYPLCCINTATIKSLVRHWIRDGWGVRDIVRHGYDELLQFALWDKEYTVFKNSMGESSIQEGELISMSDNLKKNLKYVLDNIDETRYKIRNKIWISSFKVITLNKSNLNKIKHQYSDYDFEDNYDSWANNCNGAIYMDNDTFVGLIAVSMDDKHIQKIYISDKYKFKGLYEQLLEAAVIDYGALSAVCIYGSYIYDVCMDYGFTRTSVENGIAYLVQTKVNKKLRKNCNPVYIINSYGDSTVADLISTKTKSLWSHSALSLESSLKVMYSFGEEIVDGNKRNGFIKENISDNYKSKNKPIELLCIFVSKDRYNKLISVIDEFEEKKNDTKYDYLGFLRFATEHNVEQSPLKRMCSTFIAYTLREVGIDLFGDIPTDMVSPAVLSESRKSDYVYRLFSGRSENFNGRIINTRLSKIQGRTNIVEAAEIYDLMSGKNIKHPFTIHDFIYTAKIIQSIIIKRHERDELLCISNRDVESDDNGFVFAQYNISDKDDQVSVISFIDEMNNRIESSILVGKIEIPKYIKKFGMLKLIDINGYLE